MSRVHIAQRCKTCAHPERARIDSLCAAGAEIAATARQFGLSKHSVWLHYNKHVSEAFKASIRIGPYGSEENLRKQIAGENISSLDTLKAQRSLLLARQLANFEVGADDKVASLSREIHRNIEISARICGDFAPERREVAISVMQDPRAALFVGRLGEIVRRFPEVRAPIAALVRECFGVGDDRPLIEGKAEIVHV